jgi:hypothetical protein
VSIGDRSRRYNLDPMPPKSLESEQAIREHLSVLLSSVVFAQVDRLKRFLRYVVEETIAGRS